MIETTRSIEDDYEPDPKGGLGPHSLYSIDFEQNRVAFSCGKVFARKHPSLGFLGGGGGPVGDRDVHKHWFKPGEGKLSLEILDQNCHTNSQRQSEHRR